LQLQFERPLYLLCSFGGQKNQKPRHTGRISRLLLCSKVAFGYIFQSLPTLPFKPFVCFSGAAELTRLVALYAPNQRSNSPRTLSEKHTVFHCAAYGAGWVLKLLLHAKKISQWLLQKKYSAVKITDTGCGKARKRGASLLTHRSVRPNLTLPRIAKERCRQANDERAIFSFRENS
jgi:hypothetical protein